MVREHGPGIHEEPVLDHAHGGPRKRRHRNAGDRRNGPHEFDDPDGETRVVDLLEGKAMQLSLGWVVFPRDKFKIQALRTRLQETVTAKANLLLL